MDRLFSCEKQLFREQMQQRERDTPMISVINSRTGANDSLKTVDLEPCDVGSGCKRVPSSLSAIGSVVNRHYRQLFVDRASRRLAPIYVVDTGCNDARKRRRLASETVVVLRHFEEDRAKDEGGEKETSEKKIEDKFQFSLADVDEEEAQQQQEADKVVYETARRLTERCKGLQTMQESTKLVRHLLEVKKLIQTLRCCAVAEKKDAVLLRRAILLRALLDSDDFAMLRFSPNSQERETGVIFARFSDDVTQHTVLNALAMLLELANPQTDLARLVDIAHSRPHYDGNGETWLLTEQGRILLRPEIATFSEYTSALKSTNC